MSGYSWIDGMSNNAVDAYYRGIKPLSKITAADLKRAGWTWGKRFAIDLARVGVWDSSEWHHSGGTWYNEVKFYDPEILVEMWRGMDEEARIDAERKIYEYRERENAKCEERVMGSYKIWGGTRRYPKIVGEEEFTGTLVGDWIYLDSGGRKKASGNHIKWSRI